MGAVPRVAPTFTINVGAFREFLVTLGKGFF